MKTMSGAEFKAKFSQLIASLKDDDKVIFGGGDLSLMDFKELGPKEGSSRLVQVKFNEVYSNVVD